MKLPTKSDITKVREILSRKSGGVISIEAEEPEKEVQEFKDGGNIIPEGAYTLERITWKAQVLTLLTKVFQ